MKWRCGGPRYFIGLDMGSSFIKLLLVERHRHRLILQGSGLFCPSPEIEAGEFSTAALNRIRDAIAREGLSGLSAAANIEDPSLRIRRVELPPQLPANEVLAAVRWSLRDCVEGDIEEYVVRTTPLPSRGDAGMVVAYAVKRSAVVRQCALIRQLGLRPVTVEPSAVSLLRLCDASCGWSESRYALVDFGTKVSAFTVMEKGTLLFSRPLSGICEDALVKLLVRNLEISTDAAIDVLWNYRRRAAAAEAKESAPLAGVDERVQITIQHYFSQILLEIEHSIDAFCLMFQTETLGPIYITGGASYLPGLMDYLHRDLESPLKLLHPLTRFEMPSLEEQRLAPIYYLFGVAAGLSLLALGGEAP